MKRKITNILLIILLIIIIISLSSGDNTPFSSGELKNDESVEISGFEGVFAIMIPLFIAYLVRKKREEKKKGNK